MPKRKPLVVLGLLGPTLDAGFKDDRWSRWRPSVAVCQDQALVVDRSVLLHQRKFSSLAGTIRDDIARVSPETTVELHELELDDPWDFEEVFAKLHDFVRAFSFDPDREAYLVNITTGTHVAQICWFLLCESRRIPAKLLQLQPPRRGDPADATTHAIVDLDLSKYDKLAARFEVERSDARAVLKDGIATRDPGFNALIERIEQVAVASLAPILLVGPTGAGKSQLAKQIHALRRQRHRLEGPLVEVNCATLRGDQAMSALFGHVKGAFTGALEARKGLLRRADGGVLFLDEIGELGLDEQAMLLRAIEDKTFYPTGSDREVSSDFALVSGTNQPLDALVRSGRFRADLLARIDLWTFRLPGLAERRADLEPNIDHELARAGERLGVRITMSREARDAYLAWATSKEATWPGNFRDLVASVTRLATLAEGGRVTHDAVLEEIARLRDGLRAPVSATAGVDPLRALLGAKADELDRFDRVQLADVVAVCRSSKSLAEAGRTLFAASRERRGTVNDGDRLRKYLARFDLTFEAASRG